MGGEPWSIVGKHPITDEPFGVVMNDESTFAEAEELALQLLATFRLLGIYIPTRDPNSKEGQYLFTYTAGDKCRWHLATIWASSADEANLLMNTLAADGILLMPSSG